VVKASMLNQLVSYISYASDISQVSNEINVMHYAMNASIP
jgi:hypothetical protein